MTGRAISASASSQSQNYYGAAKAVDGNLGTLWIPPLKPNTAATHQAIYVPEASERTLHLAFAETADIKLVCVNNGYSTDPTAYLNWGRVQTVESRAGQEPLVQTTLQSLSVDTMQQMQPVGVSDGPTTSVDIQLDDTYIGERIQTFDPSSCGEVPVYNKLENGETAKLASDSGCIRAPIPLAGISEVLVYAD